MQSLVLWPSPILACILLLQTSAAADGPVTNPAAPPFGQSGFSFAAFSPGGEEVLTNEIPVGGRVPEQTACLWDVKTGRLVRRFIVHKAAVYAGAFSPDGKEIVTGGGTWHGGLPIPENAELRLWDVASGREIRQYQGHKHVVQSVCFSPDGKRILSAGKGDLARLWDVQTGREIFAWPKVRGDGVLSAELSKDGRLVLTCQTGRLTIWNVSSGKEVVGIERPGEDGFFNAAQFSPDAKLVASASQDNTARTWDAATGKQVQLFAGHTSYVNQARFSADGKRLATASDDKTVRIWDVASGKEIHSLAIPVRRIPDVGFSADSRRLVATWRTTPGNAPYLAGTTLWDAQSGKELRRISTENDQCEPGPAAFTPDGKALLVHVERTEFLDCETGKTIRDYK
jgi:WD40 repeat protein